MGQELEECVSVVEEWIGAVTDEEWLPTSANGKRNLNVLLEFLC